MVLQLHPLQIPWQELFLFTQVHYTGYSYIGNSDTMTPADS